MSYRVESNLHLSEGVFNHGETGLNEEEVLALVERCAKLAMTRKTKIEIIIEPREVK